MQNSILKKKEKHQTTHPTSNHFLYIWGPAFCSVSTRLIREDHLRVTTRKKGHDKMSKILKNMNPVFQMFTPKNISSDDIWDRGLIEYDTTQLSSLSNLLIAYQKG